MFSQLRREVHDSRGCRWVFKKKLIMTVESSKGSSGLSSVSSNEEVSKVNIRWFGRCYWHMITRHSFAGGKSFVV